MPKEKGKAAAPAASVSAAAAPAPAEGVGGAAEGANRRYLTDNPLDPDETGGPINRWQNAARPQRVFRRANDRVHATLLRDAQDEVSNQAVAVANPDTEARRLATERLASAREEGEIWGLAMRLLARDIATADDPAGGPRREMLCATREGLTQQFFDDMAEVYCDVARREDISQAELDASDPPIWYGEGAWVTKVPGGDRIW
ncbi:hypothetical protein QBC34DRAFT_386529 [Podospora aff. communis PSN243]|uniref:Uncharacterized protein n=1 Tax=Podospora aff. communis PSN243 TaxID=3040156 RepID=A0AAV9G542_9PEZI|nr:hypothetical protein QBC34DRAFT_386529 [Podospora aff. communis PSN243]